MRRELSLAMKAMLDWELVCEEHGPESREAKRAKQRLDRLRLDNIETHLIQQFESHIDEILREAVELPKREAEARKHLGWIG